MLQLNDQDKIYAFLYDHRFLFAQVQLYVFCFIWEWKKNLNSPHICGFKFDSQGSYDENSAFDHFSFFFFFPSII